MRSDGLAFYIHPPNYKSHSWEQRKAVDIADYSKGNGYSKSDLTENGTPIILYGRLYTKYQFAIDEVDTFATPKDGSIYSQGNEVIIPASGETADDIARASAVEKSGILLGDAEGTTLSCLSLCSQPSERLKFLPDFLDPPLPSMRGCSHGSGTVITFFTFAPRGGNNVKAISTA